MTTRQTSPDRAELFSDAVFAVIITILVLKLNPPHPDTFGALLPLWPTGLSYVISYLFIAIVWVNHLICCMRRALDLVELRTSVFRVANPVHHRMDRRLSAGGGRTRGAVRVGIRTGEHHLSGAVHGSRRSAAHEDISHRLQRLLRMRSFITIGGFVAAAIVALRWPILGVTLICLCLIVYFRPDIPAVKNVRR